MEMIEIHEAQLAILIDGLLDISSYGVATGQSKVTRMADTTFERFRTFARNGAHPNKTSEDWVNARRPKNRHSKVPQETKRNE